MTELSEAAAEDEVSFYEEAVDRCDEKLAKAEKAVKAVKKQRAQLARQLRDARAALRKIKAKDKPQTNAKAGAAEGKGEVNR